MLEKTLEKKCCEYARKAGVLVYKFTSPSCAGVPDRFFARDGKVMFIEFKQKGKKPTTLQLHRIEEMKRHGLKVFVVDDFEYFKTLITNI